MVAHNEGWARGSLSARDIVAKVDGAHGGSRGGDVARSKGLMEKKNKEVCVEGASAHMEIGKTPTKGVMCSWFAWGMVERGATHMPRLG